MPNEGLRQKKACDKLGPTHCLYGALRHDGYWNRLSLRLSSPTAVLAGWSFSAVRQSFYEIRRRRLCVFLFPIQPNFMNHQSFDQANETEPCVPGPAGDPSGDVV